MKRQYTKQNKKLRRNKKAIAPFILDFYSYLVFIFIVLIFYFLISMKAQTQVVSITGVSDETEAHQTLLTFLRTPVEVEGEKITMADLIRLWYINHEKYAKQLSEEAPKILDGMEYEFIHPETKNERLRGYELSIQEERLSYRVTHTMPLTNGAILGTADFQSKSYESGYCVADKYGCKHLAEAFIPISDSKTLFIVLIESEKAKNAIT